MTARMAEAGISFKSGHTQVKFGIIKDSNQKGDFIVKRFSNTLKNFYIEAVGAQLSSFSTAFIL